MPQKNVAVSIRPPRSKNDATKAEFLLARVLLRISNCYGPKDKVMSFLVLTEPPTNDVLVLLREILTEDYGYEDVRWYYHDNFMWEIVISRENIPLL